MPQKLTFEYVKNFINQENILISKNYTNNTTLLEIKCLKCNNIFYQCFQNYHRGCRCRSCSNSENSKKALKKKYNTDIFLKDTTRICIQCKNNFIPKQSLQKLCNRNCTLLYNKSDIYRQNAIIYGRKGGIISAENQQRRSKAEIHFSKLCIEHYGENDIICNERIFEDTNGNKWDCDIYIKSLKLAILYDGNYHRIQINKNYNLNQVQARDKLKRKIILDNGSTFYTINDFGSYKPNN